MAVYATDSIPGRNDWQDPMNAFSQRNLTGLGGSRGTTPRFSSSASKRTGRAGFRDPYGNAKAIASISPVPRNAGAQDYLSYLDGTNNSMEGYIGLGEDPNFVYRQELEGGDRKQYGRLEYGYPYQKATVYGRPLYRNGAEYSYAAGLSADQIRQWQGFFAGLGFRTGPAGHWTQFEIDAMRSFMGMANQTPGGGMKVETLRDRVMDQVRAGVYFFRGQNENGDLLPALLGETPAGDLTGGGGGGGSATGPGFTEPFTETITRNVIQEFSVEQGMLALRNHVAQQIGRKPTDSEVRRYVKELNAAFRADPSIFTQVTTTDPITGESTTDITEDETDVSAEARALEFSEEGVPQAERYEYQAGRYFDALMAAIGM